MLKQMVLTLTFLFYPFISYAACHQCGPEGRSYVQLEDLIFNQSGIWLNDQVQQQLIGVETLRCDSFGFYVEKKEEEKMFWNCPKCGKVNKGAPYGWGCVKCSWPYDGSH